MSPRPLSHLLIAALVVVLLAACGTQTPVAPTAGVQPTATSAPPTATPLPVAVSVNGEPILQSEFDAELIRYKSAQTALGLGSDEQAAAQAVLDDLIAQVLMAQAAYQGGFSLDDAALQARLDSLAVQAGGQEALDRWLSDNGYTPESFRTALARQAAAAVTRDQIIASVPTSAEQVHVQQILVYSQAAADEVISALQSGSEFASLAALYDPLAQGDLGWFPRGYLLQSEVEAAAFSLESGQISGIVASAAGFHIIKVLERDLQRPLSPDALLTLQNAAIASWISQQRQQSVIVLSP